MLLIHQDLNLRLISFNSMHDFGNIINNLLSFKCSIPNLKCLEDVFEGWRVGGGESFIL